MWSALRAGWRRAAPTPHAPGGWRAPVGRALSAETAAPLKGTYPHGGVMLSMSGRENWHLVDAKEQIVGRLAAKIAHVLRGKHKPSFEAHRHEHGDFIVVVNANAVEFTGKKWDQKLYHWHTGYPGGLKTRTAKDMQKRKPGEVLRIAVLGMLPKNSLRRKYISRLRIFADDAHPYAEQIECSQRRGIQPNLFSGCGITRGGTFKPRGPMIKITRNELPGYDRLDPELDEY